MLFKVSLCKKGNFILKRKIKQKRTNRISENLEATMLAVVKEFVYKFVMFILLLVNGFR